MVKFTHDKVELSIFFGPGIRLWQVVTESMLLQTILRHLGRQLGQLGDLLRVCIGIQTKPKRKRLVSGIGDGPWWAIMEEHDRGDRRQFVLQRLRVGLGLTLSCCGSGCGGA